MKVKRGHWFGLDILVHVSFFIPLAIIGIFSLFLKENEEILYAPILLGVSFFFVFLHELGHVFTARRFGVLTNDITFYIFGCAAHMRMKIIPSHPRQETLIAMAGPAVNFFIVTIAIILSVMIQTLIEQTFLRFFLVSLAMIVKINIMIGLFNLIPLFPMDGGRILRGLLMEKMDGLKATYYTIRISKFLAVCMGIIGFVLGQYILLFIAYIMFFEGQKIWEFTSFYESLKGTAQNILDQVELISEIHWTSPSGPRIRLIAETIVDASSHIGLFPVLLRDGTYGVASTERLLLEQKRQPHLPVEHITARVSVVDADMSLQQVFDVLNESINPVVIVTKNGEYAGIITPESMAK